MNEHTIIITVDIEDLNITEVNKLSSEISNNIIKKKNMDITGVGFTVINDYIHIGEIKDLILEDKERRK